MPDASQPPQVKSREPDKSAVNSDRYTMPPRLESAIAAGLVCVVVYAFQFYRTGSVLRVAAVGLLIAGAAMAAGFLLGLIFAVPRETGRADSSKAESAAAEKADMVEQGHLLKQNSNLVDISDWLTKIVVGVGLVELK